MFSANGRLSPPMAAPKNSKKSPVSNGVSKASPVESAVSKSAEKKISGEVFLDDLLPAAQNDPKISEKYFGRPRSTSESESLDLNSANFLMLCSKSCSRRKFEFSLCYEDQKPQNSTLQFLEGDREFFRTTSHFRCAVDSVRQSPEKTQASKRSSNVE